MIMNSGGLPSCFSDATTATSSQQMYNPAGGTAVTATGTSSEDDVVSSSLLYNLSILQEKVHQIQSFVSFLMSQNHNDHDHNHDHRQHHQRFGSTSLAVASIGTLVQEIIAAASSMMFTCQQLHITSANNNSNNKNNNNGDNNIEGTVMGFSEQDIDPDQDFVQDGDFRQERPGQIWFSNQLTQNLDWYDSTDDKNPDNDHKDINIIVSKNSNKSILSSSSSSDNKRRSNYETKRGSPKNYDVLELDATDLLAKYTHYCQICGKGFKRDANLRMHMRAHGDQYKTPEALINPMKRRDDSAVAAATAVLQKKKHYYSCPHEGCRWNQRHEKFQPLKSIICVKNHYKRSHCPKMYVCRRCNVKQFSVLSDLRTHEKHCGDIKWVCSCGTRFSRKDKLMSHVALFVGHAPVDAAAAARAKHGGIRARG